MARRDHTEGGFEPSRRGESEEENVFSSRLIVKNLPKYVDEKRLKEHFGSHGEVTDCKVMRTREGSSRCFGFVGFAQDADAVAAQKYYNKTYMDAMKLEVEFARKVGQEAKKDAWSKYTEGTSRFKERHMATGANTVEISEKGVNVRSKKELNGGMSEKDPKLQEFLALMQPRHKKAVWANDDDVQEQGVSVKNLDPGKNIMVDAVNESDDEYEEIAGGEDDREEEGVQEDGERKVDEMVINASVSDMDYLKSRMKAEFSDDDEDEDEEDMEGEEPEESGEDDDEEEEEAEKSEGPSGTPGEALEGHASIPPNEAENNDPLEIIRQTSRLFARNLPYSANEEDVQSFFEKYGDLENVHIVMDKATRKSKGYALIQFSDPNDAMKAFTELDGSIFMGRLLHILPGKAAPQQVNGLAEMEDGVGTSSFKREKESKKKEEATNKLAWNSLFMRADTIADAVADMYAMSKSDLLDPSASDMAVRLALGEVKVINMTKEHLEENGVNINALEVAAQASGKSGKAAAGKVQRSNSTLLVKNLPYTLDEEELKALFTSIGPVLRWILPPSHTLALVEFSSNQDASNAFKKLAFKRYRSVPIYLEWAPRDVFDAKSKPAAKGQTADNSSSYPESAAKKEQPDNVAAALTSLQNGSDDAIDSSTIFVKNVAFKTKKANFENHFKKTIQECGGELKSAKIAQRNKDGKQVSAGFGFVECSNEEVARSVIQKLQGSSLDGHNLVLQLSQSKSNTATQTKAALDAPKQAATKLIVRNLAFEATREDVMNLFTAVAEVKSCRLPKKFDGSHRGFAFVEFASAGEAKNAMSAVSGTHLYGRRLVIEWASEEEQASLEEAKKKTGSNKKRKYSE